MERVDGKSAGQKRETLEMIQWRRFSNSFTRTGVTAIGLQQVLRLFISIPNKRVFQLERTLGVQEGMTKQYPEVHLFSEDYRSFTRRGVANFSNMPITEYNLTMIC